MPDISGQSFGRYHILEKLGDGGMATVYKAFDTRLERDVAVKIIRRGLFGEEVLDRFLKRFEREAKALAKLDHPNIVKVLDYGEYEGSPYLVLQYLPGGTLKRLLGKPIEWQESFQLLIPVVQALDYAHEQHVIHRDVKPSNILLSKNGSPFLSDFGVAKILDIEDGQTLTGTGVGVGTPDYMSPEQGLGRSVGPGSDVYSLGIVLYEMITGRKPYTADTPMAVVDKHLHDPLPRPTQYVTDLPEKVEKILIKALSKNPDDRYENMAALETAMQDLLIEKNLESNKSVRKQQANEDEVLNIDVSKVKEKNWMTGTEITLSAEKEGYPIQKKMSLMQLPPRLTKKPRWLYWILGLGVFAFFSLCIISSFLWGDDLITALSPTRTPISIISRFFTSTVEEVDSVMTPTIEEGKFKIAMVLIGPHDDGGWSQAHYEGLVYVEENVDDVTVTYIENVPEGADSEQVFRSLAQNGVDLIFATSYGFGDAMEVVAGEYPDTMFIHLTGIKSNFTNFGNLMGAMENMKYLAGMLAGARAKMDGNPKLGYMATLPIPEEIRLGNAIALGMKVTCPECTMDVRWINTWHDPVLEREGAASLFAAGAQVVFTGTDTPAVAEVAQELGMWGVTYDWYGSCIVDACLTGTYWSWGPIYANIAEQVIAGTYVPGYDYFDAETGALGLYGFMEGQELTPGVAELPEDVIAEVRSILAQMLAGEFDRFDVFSGPIYDNAGNLVVPEGEKLEQVDLDAFPEYGLGCTYCMKWWAAGITAELPE